MAMLSCGWYELESWYDHVAIREPREMNYLYYLLGVWLHIPNRTTENWNDGFSPLVVNDIRGVKGGGGLGNWSFLLEDNE